MDPQVRPVRQRIRKFNEERRQVIKEETKKLLSVGHKREIQYPEWLANVVLVKKANGKGRCALTSRTSTKLARRTLTLYQALTPWWTVPRAAGCSSSLLVR